MSCSSSSAFAIVVVVCSGRRYAGQTMSTQPLLRALRQASLMLEWYSNSFPRWRLLLQSFWSRCLRYHCYCYSCWMMISHHGRNCNCLKETFPQSMNVAWIVQTFITVVVIVDSNRLLKHSMKQTIFLYCLVANFAIPLLPCNPTKNPGDGVDFDVNMSTLMSTKMPTMLTLDVDHVDDVNIRGQHVSSVVM